MMKIFYVTYDGLMSSVFDSQILSLLKSLIPQIGPITLVTFERRPYSLDIKEKMNLISHQFGGELLVLPKPPFLGERFINPLSNSLAYVVSQRFSGIVPPIILHCRGQLGAYIGIRAKERLTRHRIKVIGDIRGLPADEFLYRFLRCPRMKESFILPVRYKALKNIERFAYSRADFLTCVSFGLKNYIVKCFGISSEKIEVVPSIVDTKKFIYDKNTRERMRQILHLQGKIVFTYCGSVETWQLLDKVIEFSMLANRVCHKAHLLLLIRGDKEKINRLIAKCNLNKDDVTLLSLEHQNVPQFLSAGDVGLIFRDDNLLNAVAFPVKFAEYLASGLFVISTAGASEIARFTQANKGAGYILKAFPQFDHDEIRAIFSLLETDEVLAHEKRAYRHGIARETVGIDILCSKYESLYRRLNRESLNGH